MEKIINIDELKNNIEKLSKTLPRVEYQEQSISNL